MAKITSIFAIVVFAAQVFSAEFELSDKLVVDGSSLFRSTASFSGNVGIGTASPAYKLDVNGNFRTASGSLTIFNDWIYVSPTNPNTLNSAYGVAGAADMWVNYRGYNDDFTQYRNFHVGDGQGGNIVWFDGANHRVGINNGTTANNALTVNGSADISGLVGIGTASPLWRLVVADAAFPNDTVSYLSLFRGGSDAVYGSLDLQFGFYPSATPGNRYVRISAGDNYGQRILALNPDGGKVGIGTTNPQAKLQVSGGEIQTGTSGAACTSFNAGSIRWDGASFLGCTLNGWVFLTNPVNVTGGGSCTSNNPIICTFTSNGTITFLRSANVQALIVAGGGGGSSGGGGAGGLIYNASMSVNAQTYSVVVGGGGAGGSGNNNGTNGGNSSFNGYAAIGGGGGGYNSSGLNGGSGGGNYCDAPSNPGQGTPGQGNNGGVGGGGGGNNGFGGGGGAGSVGGNASGNTSSGNGGAGLTYSISGSAVTYAGGGGGGNCCGATPGTGGAGGGGNGNNSSGVAGTANTGGGGGGGTTGHGASGGSGIVIISLSS